MNKIKNILIITITMFVILICACLPYIFGRIQDRVAQGKVVVSEVSKVVLEVSELQMFQKLKLLGNGQAIIYDEMKTELTIEELSEHVYTQLDPYIDLGLIPEYMENLSLNATPYMYIDVEGDGISHIFWNVNVISTENNYHYLDLFIDDDTGKMLVINLYCDNPIFGDNMSEILLLFRDIYFENMAVGFQVSEMNEEMLQSNTNLSFVFVWNNSEYGELTMEFVVSPHSFSNWIR